MTKILIVAEGTSDLRRAQTLVDAWLAQAVAWFDEARPEVTRYFVGLHGQDGWLNIHDIPRKFREAGFPQTFGAPFGHGDTSVLRKLEKLLIKTCQDRPDVVIWLRDIDNRPAREDEAAAFVAKLLPEQAGRCLLGFANQCGESWVLSWFQAITSTDQAMRREIQKTINRLLPRDAHLVHHAHNHGEAEWCVKKLGLDSDETERIALLRAAASANDRTGVHDFWTALNNHANLRRSLGLVDQP